MITLERLQQVKEKITQLDFYQIIHISKNIIGYYNYIIIAIDLSKQQKQDANSKELQQIRFTENLSKAEGAANFPLLNKQNKQLQIFQKKQLKYYGLVLMKY